MVLCSKLANNHSKQEVCGQSQQFKGSFLVRSVFVDTNMSTKLHGLKREESLLYSSGPRSNLVAASWSSVDTCPVTVETFTILLGHSQRLFRQGQLMPRYSIFGWRTRWQPWNTFLCSHLRHKVSIKSSFTVHVQPCDPT